MEVVEEKVKAFLSVSHGSGYGSGYGDGSGDGDGYGDGDWKAINGKAIHYIDEVPTVIESVHGNYAKGYIVGKDMQLKPTWIAKHNNFFAHGETSREAATDAYKKFMSESSVDERMLEFNRLFPDNNRPILGEVLFDWHSGLTGSCLQGRKEFVKGRYSLQDEYTVEQFCNICKDAYGGNIIRQLAESRGIQLK